MHKFKGKEQQFIEKDEEDYIVGYDENGNPIYKKTIDQKKFIRFVLPDMNKNIIYRELNLFNKIKNDISIKDKY